MLLIYGVGEDSWESPGLQEDPTSPPWRRLVLGVHWKDWCWSWNSNTLATSCKELTHWKRPDAGKDWGQEKGMTEDEMVKWHHQLDRHGFGWTQGVGAGRGGLACCDSWGHEESDTTERLNWTIHLSSVLIYGTQQIFSVHLPVSGKVPLITIPVPWGWCSFIHSFVLSLIHQFIQQISSLCLAQVRVLGTQWETPCAHVYPSVLGGRQKSE